MRNRSRILFWLNGLVLAAMVLSLAPPAAAPQHASAAPLERLMKEAGLSAPLSGDASLVGQVIGAPQVLPGMDSPPPADQAVVADARIPAWETRFNTNAGVQFMDPQGPPPGLSPTGAQVPVSGWRSYNFGGATAIRGIAAAPDGRVFVGTNGAGLRLFYHNPDGTNAWTTISASAGGLVSNHITDLGISGDYLMVGTSGSGISMMNLSTNAWTTYNTGNSNLPSNFINRINAVPSVPGAEEFYAGTFNGAWWWVNDPWVGIGSQASLVGYDVTQVIYNVVNGTRYEYYATATALWRYNGAWAQVFGGGACTFSSANAMAVDNQNGLWFAAYDYAPGAPELESPAALDPITGQPVAPASSGEAPGAPELESPAALDPITGQPVAPASSGEAPTARFPKGVCRYYNGAWTLYNTVTPGLPSNFATDLRADQDGRIWMAFSDYGGAFGGAAVWDQGTWLVFKKQYGDPLFSHQVNFVAPAGESVWFGYPDTQAVTQYSNNWASFGSAATGGTGAVTSIFIDSTETYVGRGTGVVYHNGTSWISRPIAGNTSPISRMARLNNLWVATLGNGIYEYDGTNFLPHTTVEGLASNDVRDVLVDQNFHLWAATAGGLSLRTNGYWLNFDTTNTPLLTNDLTVLTADSTGRIWIGTNGSGVFILDPAAEAGANGAPPSGTGWMQYTSADGLPGDVITGFAVQPNGTVWASGPGGVAFMDPVTSVWASATNLYATAIASDPSGRIWLGSKDGLWRWAGGQWTVHRTSSSLLDSNWIRTVAADGLRTWTASGGNVQARADFNGPIGFFVPVVSSFTPSAGVVDQIITINGSGYDDRQRTNTTVSFGNLSDPFTYGDIQLINPGSMTVKLPLLALTGKITVRANRLNGVSAANFTVLPKIKSITPTCSAMGGEIVVVGSGFNSSGQAVNIQVGGGPWRIADAQNPTSVRYRLRPGDTDGTVKVRLGASGSVFTSSQQVTIDSPVIDQVGIQQAIQGLPMVWAKRTLILLSMRSSRGLCSSRIDRGQLEFKLKNGSTQVDWQSFQPTPAGLTIGPVAPALGVNTSLSFVMWSRELSRPTFSLNDFDGVRLRLYSGPVEVVTYDMPLSSFSFYEMNGKRQILNAYVYNTANVSNSDWDIFYRNANKGLENVARVYPQSDLGAYYGNQKWLTWAWRTIGRTAMVDLSGSTDFTTLKEAMEDIRTSANDNGGSYDQGMAIIDPTLQVGSTTGKATYSCGNIIGDCDQRSAVSFNITGALSPTYLQEAIHTMGWVKDSSANYDWASKDKAHSRYNNYDSSGNCVQGITFSQALINQIGYAARTVTLEYGNAPTQFLFADCTEKQMPTSAMSYAPEKKDTNVFLEPLDYLYTFAYITYLDQLETAAGDQPATHQELRINGRILAADPHTVTISMSYLAASGGTLNSPTPGSPYHLDFRAAGGASLGTFPFDIGGPDTHGLTESDYRFSLRVPFPDATTSVAIVHEGADLWTVPVSSNPPTVSFTSPVQFQSYNADTPMPIAWSSNDPDGGTLSFILEYSADDGVTWQTITTGLSGGTFDWLPSFAPVGTSRLRITASDGFNTGQAVSEIFYIQPTNPVAIIQSPLDGAQILEGGEITLLGDVIASDSSDPVQYDWYYDGSYFATGQVQGGPVTDIGPHTIGLQVIANGLPSAMTSISFTVVPDTDRDGLSNDYEQAYGINPLDRSDSAADPDGDGLQTLVEQQMGTLPNNPDTDGDGVDDGAEIALGGMPNDPAVTPPPTPLLQVGADLMGFDYIQGDALPAYASVWVTNGGAGTLNWSVQSDSAWLTALPGGGTAPSELQITADPSGLSPGEYFGTLTVNAPGTAGSPHVINVFLRVYDANGNGTVTTYLYLPVVVR